MRFKNKQTKLFPLGSRHTYKSRNSLTHFLMNASYIPVDGFETANLEITQLLKPKAKRGKMLTRFFEDNFQEGWQGQPICQSVSQ